MQFSTQINSKVNSFFYSIEYEKLPDSNIVIIEINSSDIDFLGGWPLKRSYYALLLDYLNKLNVRKIGFEIFLSENISTQEVYNQVLFNSIKNSNNIIFSSLAENLTHSNNIWISEKINFPQIKLFDKNLQTGHINFFNENIFLIPAKIKTNDNLEFSFADKMLENKNPSDIYVNFNFSWKSFKKYSLLQFFDFADNNITELQKLNGKIILIGISDPLIAKSISTHFDDRIPGIAIHAFAINNLLSGENLNYNYFKISTIIFLFTIFIISYFLFDKFKILLSASVVFFIIIFSLWKINYFQFDYSAFIIPYIFTIWGSSFITFLDERKKRITSEELSIELKSELEIKEAKLLELNRQIEKNKSDELKNQINKLNEEIKNLKNIETEDNTEFIHSIEPNNFEGIIYRSKKIEQIVSLIKKVAPENASVLIQGESGTGKELVANAIHNLSKRKNKKFVIINCAALPETLLESELFGHVKGAFTDAKSDKIGRFEEADGGTLFLDEIGETSENFQVKLLRVLQTGDFQKVGSSKTQHVDVRIITATNKNLSQQVKTGNFREDLFYRLNVIDINLPNLNERIEDISVLAEFFAKKESKEFKISNAVIKKLEENNWKGNIRELEGVIKRAVIFTRADKRNIIKLKDLPKELSKIEKSDMENSIIESLREKSFSHSSINETSDELGNLSRTIVSEYLRGFFFKSYVENNFDLEKTIKIISNSNKTEINQNVDKKVNIYLKNLESDFAEFKGKSLNELKSKFASKYKNLPQKYHSYLDQIIQKITEN
ncbi:MAG: sigma 54-interacting transcriptional regulator [Ignavibacteriae bacterium]|nr:sigma 54-interacting transcriptional regulator [Ignavibacteriota bacterium]